MKIEVEEIFTLSSYDGRHLVDGSLPERPSFAESLTPLDRMIRSFSVLPTGTKIKVIMENVE